MSNSSLVTISSFNEVVSAHSAKGKLESEGIQAFVLDDNVGSTMPHIINAIGGIRLQVREDVAQRAMEILNGTDYPEILPVEASFEEPTYRIKRNKAKILFVHAIIALTGLTGASFVSLGAFIAVFIGILLLSYVQVHFIASYVCGACLSKVEGHSSVCPSCHRELIGEVGSLKELKSKELQEFS